MKKMTRKIEARFRCKKFTKGIAVLACLALVSGCEILSICTYPSEKLTLGEVLPEGKFWVLIDEIDDDDEATLVSKVDSGYVFESDDDVSYMELFELDSFVGFNSRPMMPGSDEISSIPKPQREMIREVLSNGLYPWYFGAVEVYGKAFMILIPLVDDVLVEYIEERGISVINNGVSRSAANQVALEQARAKRGQNSDDLLSYRVLDKLPSSDREILMTTPDELEGLTAELIRDDLLIPFVYVPESGRVALQGLEGEELDVALRAYNKPLADRYEHLMAAFEARDNADD